jgi:hypothetical protein
MANLQKEVWEGWTVQDFIDELEPVIDIIMRGESWTKPFQSKLELARYTKENQPYYKKTIPGVNAYFANKYGLK